MFNLVFELKFENWCNNTLIFINFALKSILSGPLFLKSRYSSLQRDSADQSPTFPAINPIKVSVYPQNIGT